MVYFLTEFAYFRCTDHSTGRCFVGTETVGEVGPSFRYISVGESMVGCDLGVVIVLTIPTGELVAEELVK